MAGHLADCPELQAEWSSPRPPILTRSGKRPAPSSRTKPLSTPSGPAPRSLSTPGRSRSTLRLEGLTHRRRNWVRLRPHLRPGRRHRPGRRRGPVPPGRRRAAQDRRRGIAVKEGRRAGQVRRRDRPLDVNVEPGETGRRQIMATGPAQDPRSGRRSSRPIGARRCPPHVGVPEGTQRDGTFCGPWKAWPPYDYDGIRPSSRSAGPVGHQRRGGGSAATLAPTTSASWQGVPSRQVVMFGVLATPGSTTMDPKITALPSRPKLCFAGPRPATAFGKSTEIKSSRVARPASRSTSDPGRRLRRLDPARRTRSTLAARSR